MRKKPSADLKKYYTVYLEIGLILALLMFITAANVTLTGSGSSFDASQEQELVQVDEIPQTEQQKEPAPLKPQVPQEVPDDVIIEDDIINLDSDLDFDEALELPPSAPGGEPEEEEEEFFEAVEHMPELIGGIQGLHDRIQYPAKAKKTGIHGTVHLQFIVNEKGEVENPVVLRGIGGGCDEEALRVIKEAKFKPGRQMGRAVRVLVGQQIHFRLINN